MLACIPSLLTLQVEPNLQTFNRTLSPEALRYLHIGIHIGKSHPHLKIFIMARAARQDDQGNVIHIRGEGEEGESHDTEGRGIGDDRGQGIPDNHDPCDPHIRGALGGENPDLAYGGYHPCHGLDPLPPDLMDLLGNLVEALHDAGLQANPGYQHRFQQAVRRHAQGGILPDPNLNPNLDSDDDDAP